MTLIWLAVCGAAGVVARYGLGLAVQSIWTVVAINLAGSFLLGFLVHAGAGLSEDTRTALGVGFLGGFTTFSTMTVQTVFEIEGGRETLALAYLVVTILGGLAVAIAGYLAGRLLT